jgi:hypothetical protein
MCSGSGCPSASACGASGADDDVVFVGPYEESAWIEQQAEVGNLGAKLSLVRLGFNYFTSEADPPAEALADPPLSDELKRGRWFPIPADAVRELRQLGSPRARTKQVAAQRPALG